MVLKRIKMLWNLVCTGNKFGVKRLHFDIIEPKAIGRWNLGELLGSKGKPEFDSPKSPSDEDIYSTNIEVWTPESLEKDERLVNRPDGAYVKIDIIH